MSIEVPQVSTRIARAVVRAATSNGASEAEVLSQCGLSRAEIEFADGYVSLPQMNALWLAAARAADGEDVGLQVVRNARRGDFGVLEYLIPTHPTVGSALGAYVRFQRLLQRVAGVWETSHEPDGDCVVSLRFLVPRMPVHNWVAEFGLSSIVTTLTRNSNAPWQPRAVELVRPPPADVSPYVAAFGARPRFGADIDAVRLGRDTLGRSLREADEVLREILETTAVAQLQTETPPRDDDIAGQVKVCIERTLDACTPGVVARALGVSERTLRRRLLNAGVSFSGLLNDVRSQRAKLYLADPRLAITEIAFLLGFSEVASFTRAFKRWYGVTPGQYRLDHQSSR